jgi:hypothetical protein
MPNTQPRSDTRRIYLQQTGQSLQTALARGAAGKAFQVQVETVVGPRAGAVHLYAGLGAGRTLRYLAADDGAAARQFIAWPFPGEPAIFMAGKAVRIEAGWPDALAETEVRLNSVGCHPEGQGRWLAGIDERRRTITAGFSDQIPHWLFAGTSGSGKTVAIRSAAYQLASDRQNRLIFIDGKYGAGLGALMALPGTIGPVAVDINAARNALAWINTELQQRYLLLAQGTQEALETVARLPRLILFFDEFQEFTGDAQVRELTRRILAQGRAARIHAILATQHPTNEAFGDDNTLKRNLVGRIALKVTDAKASEVAIGDTSPRADRLMGKGDAYTIGPGRIYRAQLLLVDHHELEHLPRQRPQFETWPESKPEELGQEPTVRWAYTGEELAHGLVAATQNWGRRKLLAALTDSGNARPGVERARRLLDLGREQLEALESLGYTVMPDSMPALTDGN